MNPRGLQLVAIEGVAGADWAISPDWLRARAAASGTLDLVGALRHQAEAVRLAARLAAPANAAGQGSG